MLSCVVCLTDILLAGSNFPISRNGGITCIGINPNHAKKIFLFYVAEFYALYDYSETSIKRTPLGPFQVSA